MLSILWHFIVRILRNFCIIQIYTIEVALCFLTISSPHVLSSITFNPALFATITLRLLSLTCLNISILPDLVFVSSIVILIDFAKSVDTLIPYTCCFFLFLVLGPQAHKILVYSISHINHSSQFVQSFFLFIYFCFLCGRQNNTPPRNDVHILFPGTCEYVTLDGKGDFAVAVKDLAQ